MITFVTPVSPSHLEHVRTAALSVLAQTVPCKHVIVVDHDRLGPGNARNAGLLTVDTAFVSFLDADDEIAPTFAAETLRAWRGRYLYTDWREGDVIRPAPKCAWVGAERQAHLITAVIPTVWAMRVGGFDTDLPGGEDTDFFLKLVSAGYCGQRVPLPLFTYGAGGERSRRFVNSPDFAALHQHLFERYAVTMACCGQGDAMNPLPPNDVYVLVEVTPLAAGGTQHRRGLATGNIYDRVGIGETLWVDPVDADHPSGFFRRIVTEEPEPPSADDLLLVAEIMGTPAVRMPVGKPAKPDVAKVLDLWRAKRPEPVLIPEEPSERLKLVEEEYLTDDEVDALRNGDTVNLTSEGTATITPAPTPRRKRAK